MDLTSVLFLRLAIVLSKSDMDMKRRGADYGTRLLDNKWF